MGCPKNPRKRFFGIFQYNGPHKFEKRVSRWMSDMFRINYHCPVCGCQSETFGIEWQTMLDCGYDPDFLRAMSCQDYGMTEDQWREKMAKGERI